MFKELLHSITSITGTHPAQGVVTASQLATSMQNTTQKRTQSAKRIFMGNIEVLHVSNGYVVNIGIREGYEYTTHIASTIVEVNEIIAAAMVAFQLES